MIIFFEWALCVQPLFMCHFSIEFLELADLS